MPPDPIPVNQPRPENYALANQGGGAFRGNGPIPIPVLPASTVLRPWGFAGPRLTAIHFVPPGPVPSPSPSPSPTPTSTDPWSGELSGEFG